MKPPHKYRRSSYTHPIVEIQERDKNVFDTTQEHGVRQFIRAVCQMFHKKEIFTEKKYSLLPYFQPSTYCSFTTRVHKQQIKLLNIAQALHHIRHYKFPSFLGINFCSHLNDIGQWRGYFFYIYFFFLALRDITHFLFFDLLFLSTCFLFVFPFVLFSWESVSFIFFGLWAFICDKRFQDTMEDADSGFLVSFGRIFVSCFEVPIMDTLGSSVGR